MAHSLNTLDEYHNLVMSTLPTTSTEPTELQQIAKDKKTDLTALKYKEASDKLG